MSKVYERIVVVVAPFEPSLTMKLFTQYMCVVLQQLLVLGPVALNSCAEDAELFKKLTH